MMNGEQKKRWIMKVKSNGHYIIETFADTKDEALNRFALEECVIVKYIEGEPKIINKVLRKSDIKEG